MSAILSLFYNNSNIILATLTAIYVVLTYILVKENRSSNEKHFRILTLPHLYCEVAKGDENNIQISVYNAGNIPAFDVDILLLLFYSSDEISPDQYEKKYLNKKLAKFIEKQEGRKISIITDEDGIYNFYDRLCYYYFSAKKKVVCKISSPSQPFFVTALMQYRDVFGVNYCQIYDYAIMDDIYKLSALQPKTLSACSRIEMDYSKRGTLKTENHAAIPKYLKDSFVESFKISLPLNYVSKWPPRDVEDRGQWINL